MLHTYLYDAVTSVTPVFCLRDSRAFRNLRRTPLAEQQGNIDRHATTAASSVGGSSPRSEPAPQGKESGGEEEAMALRQGGQAAVF